MICYHMSWPDMERIIMTPGCGKYYNRYGIKINVKVPGCSGIRSIRWKQAFLYVILFSASFNDILRPGASKITLFRILMFAGPFICLSCMRKTIFYFYTFFFLTIISFIQTIFFAGINEYGIGFDPGRFIRNIYYYLCIMVVICIVHTLLHMERNLFFSYFRQFICYVSILYLIVFIVSGLKPGIREYLFINNINDYGAVLAAVFPFFAVAFLNHHDIKSGAAAGLIAFFCVYNDCKLALLGVAAEVFILWYLYQRQKIKNLRFMLVIFVLIVLGIVFYILKLKNISVNGYEFQGAVLEPIRHILDGQMYGQSNSSATYRANVWITGIIWLLKTGCAGIGVGNAGVLIRSVLGRQNLYETWMLSDSVSVHNALLEFMLEFGFIAVFTIVVFAVNILKSMKCRRLNDDQMVCVSSIVSAVFWLQGPSGIVTDYFIFMLFTYFLFAMKYSRLEKYRK